MNFNKIAMEKRLSILIDSTNTNTTNNEQLVATFLKNLSCYGYTLSVEAIDKLNTLSKDEIISLHNELIKIIKNIKGEKAKIEPLYKNFPMDVMDKTEGDLFMDALIYAISSFSQMPSSEKEERFPLIDNSPVEIINLITMDEFLKIFTNLAGSKSSISKGDMDLLREYIVTFGDDILKHLPQKIYFKEILAHITSLCVNIKGAEKEFAKLYSTGTDVLRLAVALSDGDVSLSTIEPFISFKRPVRRFLLSLLENSKDLEEHMKKNKGLWIALGEKLHPGEYKQFPKTKETFRKVRENEKLESFYSKLQEGFSRKDESTVLKLLASRPGEFARNLDFSLRTFNNDVVLNNFSLIAEKVSSPILLQLREFYIRRNDEKDIRVFFPKGSVSKCFAIENNLAKIDESSALKVVNICTDALIKNFSGKDNLGKVYIDESLKKYIIPMQLRSSSKAIKTLARGSRMKLEEDTNILRMFLYWHQTAKQNYVDLDLSVALLDEHLNMVQSISYYNISDSTMECYHSGDVRTAPNGATEFIDLNINLLKENGIKYITTSVYSYTSEKFIDLKDCFVGYMERTEINSGEIYEPSTVKNKVDLTAEGTNSIPFIVDLENMEIVWADIVGNVERFSNNETSKNRLFNTTKSILNCAKPNMYDLALLHATARGEITTIKEEADIVFSSNEGITPFDTDIILADYI